MLSKDYRIIQLKINRLKLIILLLFIIILLLASIILYDLNYISFFGYIPIEIKLEDYILDESIVIIDKHLEIELPEDDI